MLPEPCSNLLKSSKCATVHQKCPPKSAKAEYQGLYLDNRQKFVQLWTFVAWLPVDQFWIFHSLNGLKFTGYNFGFLQNVVRSFLRPEKTSAKRWWLAKKSAISYHVSHKAGCRSYPRRHVRCGRALLQSAVVADLLVVQVLEGEPVAEG